MNNIANSEQKSITNIPKISAIYFALLQCGYDYYTIRRDARHIATLQTFFNKENHFNFFSKVKQPTCTTYPYWPRAALLETASFFLDPESKQFQNFNMLQQKISSTSNISDTERNQAFWDWLTDFPSALQQVLQEDNFKSYLKWENEWIAEQNLIHKKDMLYIYDVLNFCLKQYNATKIKEISVVLNPIKCVYSADYHWIGNRFIICSGAFSKTTIVHEFLHSIVHPVIKTYQEEILQQKILCPDIDKSYYLIDNEIGRLNAFEEYFVRTLTDAVLTENPPTDLHSFLKKILRNFS